MTTDEAAAGPAAAPGRPFLLAVLGAACISCSAILVTLAGTAAATTAFFRCGLALPLLAATMALVAPQFVHGFVAPGVYDHPPWMVTVAPMFTTSE